MGKAKKKTAQTGKKGFFQNLSNQILIGFILGIGTGLFFGEESEPLQIVGDVFIKLLQMTVLPYMSFSLIAGLGQMTMKTAINIAKVGLMVILLLWSVVFVILLLFPVAFPTWESATFFNPTLVTPKQDFDFLTLFIPNNPFYSFANNLVPAVVVFSIGLGVAIMTNKQKGGVINGLKVINEALIKVTSFIVKLAPIGVFAIAAKAAGTMGFTEFSKIQIYLYVFITFSVITTFIIVPGLVSVFTPIKYRRILSRSKGVLITAFATGNLFVVLSLLITRTEELLVSYGVDEEDARTNVGIIVPTSFNFPSMGKLFSLSFVTFAAWFAGSSLNHSDYFTYLGLGLFTFFGNTIVALEFLLDQFRIPHDTLQLFMLTDIVGSRFGTMLGAMSTIGISLLTVSIIKLGLKVNVRKLIILATSTLVILIGGVFTLHQVFNNFFEEEYQGYDSFVSMELLNEPVPTTVYDNPVAAFPIQDDNTLLDEIMNRGYLRIGYVDDALPFVFKNKDGHLVGYDVDMANALAKDMRVDLNFVHINRKEVNQMLNEGYVDVVMSGIHRTLDRELRFSDPYMDETFGLLTLDYRRKEFRSSENLMEDDSVVIGLPDDNYYYNALKRQFPQAHLIPMESPRSFLNGDLPEMDAFCFTAEAGSAWTLVYPNYSVVVPQPDVLTAPVCIVANRNSKELIRYINNWIDLKQRTNDLNDLYGYWIYGHIPETTKRWSIKHDVLGW